MWRSKRKDPRPRPAASPPAEGALEAVRRTTSLPSGVFKAFDKKVENALAGDAAEVFLSHMTAGPNVRPSPDLAPSSLPAHNPHNQVSADEVRGFVERYCGADCSGSSMCPDVTAGLRNERMWVLTDLATHGSGRARELATRELRGMVRRMGTTDEFDVEVLRRLVDAIESRSDTTGASVLLQVLLNSARRALRTLDDQLHG